MADVFTKEYVEMYDAMYASKDYEAESSWLNQVLGRNRIQPPARVLDVGCGTGRHAVQIASSGYQVTGVDRSNDMLDVARSRATELSVDIRFVHANVQDFMIDETFDAAVMLFSVIGYLGPNEDLTKGLSNIRRHLRGGGLLVFDYWYGPAVLNLRPGPRFREDHVSGESFLRYSSGTIDHENQMVSIDVSVWRIAGDHVIGRARERHEMRYFFPQELVLLLKETGFVLSENRSFPSVEDKPHEGSWSAAAIAVAV